MIKSLSLSTALLSICLLVSAGSVSARTGGTVDSISPGSAIHLVVVAAAITPSKVLDVLAMSIYMDGQDEPGDNKDTHEDQDKDDRGPKPSPEPSTMLSFGVALLVGGGVLLSRRLRRNQK
jgi:hypothetical protein